MRRRDPRDDDTTETTRLRSSARPANGDYEPSKLSSWLTGPVAAALLAAVFVLSALVPGSEPVHSPLVGPLVEEGVPAEMLAGDAARGAEPARAAAESTTAAEPPAAAEPTDAAEPEVAAQATGDAGDLTRADPASQEVDPERLARGIERLRGLGGFRSVLVVRNGRVIAEESFAGSDLNRRPHDVKSASKSILSALVGIAIERGEIAGVDATVAELLPEYASGLPGAKREITLGDLLAMEAGLASTSGEHYGAWVAHDDWTAAALARPLASDPGGAFTYSTGSSHLVSAILTEATGRSTLELARDRLLGPIGVEVAGWDRSPEGYYFGGNSFRITSYDLARFGQLYLQEGRWNGRRVVPEAWVEESTRRHSEGWPDRYGAYGYLWWLPPDDPWDSFAAVGYGGQFLYVVPELDMLVVTTATIEGKGAAWDRQAFEILREEIFGAAR